MDVERSPVVRIPVSVLDRLGRDACLAEDSGMGEHPCKGLADRQAGHHTRYGYALRLYDGDRGDALLHHLHDHFAVTYLVPFASTEQYQCIPLLQSAQQARDTNVWTRNRDRVMRVVVDIAQAL